MKKLVLATLGSIFILAANADVISDADLTNVTSAKTALIDNSLYIVTNLNSNFTA